VVEKVMAKFDLSERRACEILGQHRSTQRYQPQRPDLDEPLARELKRIANRKPSWGYRRAAKYLRHDLGWKVNDKRVRRVWNEHGLKASPPRRTGKKALGSAENAIWNLPPEHPHHIWSLDFVEQRLSNGRKYRILNVIDEFTRRSLGCVVEHSINSKRVQDELNRLFRAHGKPGMVRTDNGREFIAGTLANWLGERGVDPRAVEKGKPQQNGYIESFHSTMGADLLRWEHFDTLLEARTLIQRWCKKDFNAEHRHSGLYDLTPNEFAHTYRQALKSGSVLPKVKLAGVAR